MKRITAMRWLGAGLLAIAACVAFAVFAVPVLLRPVLEDFIGDLSGRDLRAERIRFQPLTLTVVLEQVSLAPVDKEAAWRGSASVERVSARLGLRGFTPQINRLDLRALQLGFDAAGKADSTPFDLLSVLPEARRPEHWLSTLPVRQVHIGDGQISLHSAGEPPIIWDGLELHGVMIADGLDFEVSMGVDGGADWHVAGSLDWPARSAEGRYRIERLDLAAFSGWFGLNPGTDGGTRTRVEGDYRLYRNNDRWQIDLPNSSAQSGQLELCMDTCALLQPFAAQFDASISQAPGELRLESVHAKLDPLVFAPGGSEEAAVAINSLVVTLESFERNGNGRGRLDILAESAQGGLAQLSGWLQPASAGGAIEFSLTAWPLQDLWPTPSTQRSTGNAYAPTTGELTGTGEAWIEGDGFSGLGSFVASDVIFEHPRGHTIAIGKLSAPSVGLVGWPLQAETSQLEVENPSLTMDSTELWSLLAPGPAIGGADVGEDCQSITNVRINAGRITLQPVEKPLVLSSLDGWISGLCGGRWSAFELMGGEPGGTRLQARGRRDEPGGQPSVTLIVELEDPSAALAEPALQRRFGGRVGAGDLKLDLAYRLWRDHWSGVQRVDLASLEVLPGTASGGLGPEWIAALLTHPDNTVRLELQDSERAIPPPRTLGALLESAIDDYLPAKDVTPLQALAKLNGLSEVGFGEIPFAPGNAAIGSPATDRLVALGSALRYRPQVLLKLTGAFDPGLDRRALQVQQLRTHVALATASGLALQTGNLPLDFSDSKVHSVLDEFASRRMPPAALEVFNGQFAQPDNKATSLPGTGTEQYYAALFDALVEYSVVPDSALASLARYRQQAAADGLVAQGIERGRLLREEVAVAVQASGTGIPLPLTLELATPGIPPPTRVGQPPSKEPSTTRGQ